MREQLPRTHGERYAIAVLILLVIGTTIAGTRYLHSQYLESDSQIHLRLTAVARTKASQLEEWRAERLGEARVVVAAMELMPAATGVLRGHATANEQRQTNEWLAAISANHGYKSVVLLAPGAKIAAAAGTLEGDGKYYDSIQPEDSQTASEAAFSRFHTNGQNGAPRISVIAPVHVEPGASPGKLVLEIDPRRDLYPELTDWPSAGKTGESYLVERDGAVVNILSDRRLTGRAALTDARKLTVTNSPAVQAVTGGTDRIDGTDYRGQAVMASACPVANSGWFVVAKVDRAEVFAEHNAETVQLVSLLALLVLLCGAVARMLHLRHGARLYREKYDAVMARENSEGRYNHLTQLANDAILFWQPGGRIVEANDKALRMFGYSREEIAGKNLQELKPWAMAEDFLKHEQEIPESDGVVFETRNIRRDGTEFPTEVSTCWVEMEGRRMGLSVIRDISERRQAEEQIRNLNRLYALLSGCNAAIIRAKSEAELFEAVCRIAVDAGGFRISWVGGLNAADSTFVPVAKAGEAWEYLGEVTISYGEGATGNGPAGRCVREGKAAWSTDVETDERMGPWQEAAARYGLRSTICVPVKRQGAVRYVLGMYAATPGFFSGAEIRVAEEIGDSLSFALERFDAQRAREAAEAAREREAERLAMALDAAQEGYWEWRVDTDEWNVSPHFYRMLGYEPGEVEFGMEYLWDSVHPEDRAQLEKKQSQLMEGGEDVATGEFRVRRKDGQYIWVLGKIKVLERDERGLPLRIIETRLDLTERKAIEQQLLQSQKMESVGRLAGGVAHDFNNQLTVITGFAELMREEVPADSSLMESLDTILEAGDHAAALTRQLLTFSRRESENRTVLNVNASIRAVEKMVRRLVGENVELRLELAENAGPVLADETQLEQVVMNLAVNARDAITGRGHLTIRTGNEWLSHGSARPGREGAYVRITVSDDGCGMTPEVRAHIFEPFFTTKDKSRGTGLGLATVYAIVDRSGGFIEVESEKGKGTSFFVYLPVHEAAETIVTEPPGKLRSLRGSETILLAEDEPQVRRAATEILKKRGYKVLVAENGAEAILASQEYEGHIDLLLTDIMMPGMNGPELAERMVTLRPDIKVLYASGYADETISIAELTQDGAMFIAKPYRPETLAVKVRDILSDSVRAGNGDRDGRQTG